MAQKSSDWTAPLALGGSIVYATIRYHLAKGVAWADWPTYTLNKAFGVAALVVIVAAVLRRTALEEAKAQMWRAAGLFSAVHVILSLALLSPAYYENFFTANRLKAEAGWSMLFGGLAGAWLLKGKMSVTYHRPEQRRGALSVLLLMVGVHAGLQGYRGWIAPSTWPGLMPPITLLSFLISFVGALLVLSRGPTNRQASEHPPATKN